jgi:hypothetical protein
MLELVFRILMTLSSDCGRQAAIVSEGFHEFTLVLVFKYILTTFFYHLSFLSLIKI